MNYKLIHNTNEDQYEYHIDGQIAKIEYTPEANVLIITHTEFPRQLEGQGVGHQLVKETLDDIQKNQWKMVPVCPFVVEYVRENPQYMKLIP